NVFLMNTAFTAGTNSDAGNLVLEKESFYDEIKLLKDQENSINIAIGHHPISYFVEADQQKIWNLFNDFNIDFYLCGHLHKGAYVFNLSGERTIPTYQCGSGRVDNYATVTFLVGELDIEKRSGKLVSYKWMPNEECWTIGGMNGRRSISGEMDIALERQIGKAPEFEGIAMYKESERKFVVTHNTNIKPVSYFVGREKELQDLRQKIEGGCKTVMVSGMGGIGKTHICRKLFDEYYTKHEKGEDELFRHIGYIEYNGNMDSSLMECLRYKTQDTPKLNKEAAWRELEYLASGGKILLFVDNVDKSISEDPSLKKLENIPCTIILTSRQISFSDAFKSYQIGFLDRKQCIEIFKTIRFEDSGININEEEKRDLEYVIEKLAGRHTITVELLAHLAKTKLWTVKKLREELENKGFRLVFHKDGGLINIQESYEKLYSLSKLTQAEQNIMEAFSVFPYIPLAAQTCNEWLLTDAGVSEDNDILMGLYQKGWLQLDKESYALHPVFAQIIFERYKPEEEKHHGLIEACRKCLEIPQSGSALECQKFIPFAENISERLIRENSMEQADFTFDIAYLLSYIAEYKKAEELY
ncbi:MAG: hypothetical protein K2O91_18845, partial [Lachnospiraceae bacterium]|nr:hypothetical protein [Lachnospiraceae bacterium]